ncbi:MAG: Gp37 family protein [Desulfobulbus sp.]
MTLLDIEKALVAAVKEELPGYEVRSYPEKPAEYVLTHPKGAILIRFSGSKYEPTQDIGAMVQARRTDWEITVVARHLTDHGGLYAILEVIRICLTGYRVPGCRKAYLLTDGFVGEVNGIWQYALLLAVPTVAVERAEDEYLPVLKRLTLTDNLGGTEEIE